MNKNHPHYHHHHGSSYPQAQPLYNPATHLPYQNSSMQVPPRMSTPLMSTPSMSTPSMSMLLMPPSPSIDPNSYDASLYYPMTSDDKQYTNLNAPQASYHSITSDNKQYTNLNAPQPSYYPMTSDKNQTPNLNAPQSSYDYDNDYFKQSVLHKTNQNNSFHITTLMPSLSLENSQKNSNETMNVHLKRPLVNDLHENNRKRTCVPFHDSEEEPFLQGLAKSNNPAINVAGTSVGRKTTVSSDLLNSILDKGGHRASVALNAYKLDKEAGSKKFELFDTYSYFIGDLIIEYEFSIGNHNHTRDRFKDFREAIVKKFPCHLTPGDWYSPSSGKLTARGILMNSYRKIKAQAEQVNIFKGFKKRSLNTGEESSESISEEKSDRVIDDFFIEDWQSKYAKRKAHLSKFNVDDFILRYQDLKNPDGYKLILADFKKKNGDDCMSRLAKFLNRDIDTIIRICNDQPNPILHKYFEEHYEILTSPKKENLILHLFPIILKTPGSTYVDAKNKCSTQELLDSFIFLKEELNELEDSDIADIHDYLRTIHEKTGSVKVLPCIVFCGKLDSLAPNIYFILNEECIYRINTLREALEVYIACFNIFEKLHCKLNRHIVQFLTHQLNVTTGSLLESVKLMNLNLELFRPA